MQLQSTCIAGGFRMMKRGGLDAAEDRDKISYSFQTPLLQYWAQNLIDANEFQMRKMTPHLTKNLLLTSSC